MFLDDQNNPQTAVLAEALRLAGYAAVCAGVLAVTDASEYPDATKQAIGRLGERMATFNGGQPEAGTILHTIATIGWEDAGIAGVPALTTADRAALIGIVMAVCKEIIDNETVRLSQFVAADTALPADWAGPVDEPEPDPEPEPEPDPEPSGGE